MTTYMPSITLPQQIFAQPAASIFLPIILGNAVGFIVSGTSPYTCEHAQHQLTDCASAKSTQGTYRAIKKPPLNPPGWVFGPVWAVLYGMMGYSAYRAWTTGMASFNPTTQELTKAGTEDEPGNLHTDSIFSH